MKKHPMRRILLSTAATVSGVVLMLALKAPGLPSSTTQATGLPAAPPASAPAGAPPGGGAPEQQGGSGQEEPARPADPPQQQEPQQPADPGDAADRQEGNGSKKPASPSDDGAGAGAGTAARTVTGDAVQTDYGPVQVKLTVTGGRITQASAAQAPSSTPMSKQITSSAVPQLNQKAVTAQGGEIDAVSGATYTSEGYINSLQSALDKAGV